MLITITVASCSGSSSPVTPGSPGDNLAGNPGVHSSTNKMLWGLYDVRLDPVSMTTEVIPHRAAEFRANVTMFLQPPAGNIHNLGIQITDVENWLTEGLLDVNVTLTHPFPGLDYYTGFDVLGVFINYGDTTGLHDPGIFYTTSPDNPRLLNPDGYTRWFNPVEFELPGILGFTEGTLGNKAMGFSATLNPYKYFCDTLDFEDDFTEFLHNPNSVDDRGLFSSTGTNTREYQLQFPLVDDKPWLVFQYAVVAAWEEPLVDPPIDIPSDFPISANASEACHLSVADNGSTLFYDNGSGGGTVSIRAELFDWGAAINPSGILGEFSRIIIESPNSPIVGNYLEFYPADFAPYIEPGTAVSSVANLEFTGVEPISTDDVQFLVTVETNPVLTYDQGYGTPAPDELLASYFMFSIPVGSNPCANFTVTGADPDPGESGMQYEGFEVYGTNFQSGSNLAVDIMDGDTVVVSATNVSLIDSTTITCDLDLCGVNPGSYDLRVTNGCDPVSYGSMPYTIDPDPLKNIELRDGALASDLGVCQDTSEIYVVFSDYQLWLYTGDYSTGTFKNAYPGLNRVEAQRQIDSIPNEATMGNTGGNGQYIYDQDEDYFWYAGYTGNLIDVIGPYGNSRHYYFQNASTYMRCSRRNINQHGGYVSLYLNTGSGSGYVNMVAVSGVDCSRNLDENASGWFYYLEGAPEYTVERTDYHGSGSDHYQTPAGTYLSGPGDGNDEINDPLDISCDYNNNVYILDILSTGEPVVKVYDSDMTYIGSFGDSTSISGTPLRIDCDEGDDEVHVLHTDGVSIFRPCELPV